MRIIYFPNGNQTFSREAKSSEDGAEPTGLPAAPGSASPSTAAADDRQPGADGCRYRLRYTVMNAPRNGMADAAPDGEPT